MIHTVKWGRLAQLTRSRRPTISNTSPDSGRQHYMAGEAIAS
jgi:hypothetical protein